MCEYCGCQALQTIDELTREHDAALGHVRDAEQAAAAGDLPAARTACVELALLLVPHTAVEEEAVSPALAREHPAHVEVLVHEHRVVHSALAELVRLRVGSTVVTGPSTRVEAPRPSRG